MMHNKVRLSKRQIKEDKFTAFMLSTKRYANDNWQYVALGAIALALVFFAIGYFTTSASSRVSESASRFSQALLEYRNGNNQVAMLSFSQIVDEFGDQEVAEQSTF
ncbi:MAG: hypothetical protein P1R58_04445, partial [bacterium]|nr:hypothetical protein [bacterium]